VMPADVITPPCSSHVGCVNALVLCGNKYVCSAGGDAMVRGGWPGEPSGVPREAWERRRAAAACCRLAPHTLHSGLRYP
jgi:hypothetical protein